MTPSAASPVPAPAGPPPAPGPGAPPRVDAAFVERVLALARLEAPADEVAALVPQLERILDLVARVQAIELPAGAAAHLRAVGLDALRDDTPGPTLPRRAVSANAPEHDGAFLVVPKFLTEGD